MKKKQPQTSVTCNGGQRKSRPRLQLLPAEGREEAAPVVAQATGILTFIATAFHQSSCEKLRVICLLLQTSSWTGLERWSSTPTSYHRHSQWVSESHNATYHLPATSSSRLVLPKLLPSDHGHVELFSARGGDCPFSGDIQIPHPPPHPPTPHTQTTNTMHSTPPSLHLTPPAVADYPGSQHTCFLHFSPVFEKSVYRSCWTSVSILSSPRMHVMMYTSTSSVQRRAAYIAAPHRVVTEKRKKRQLTPDPSAIFLLWWISDLDLWISFSIAPLRNCWQWLKVESTNAVAMCSLSFECARQTDGCCAVWHKNTKMTLIHISLQSWIIRFTAFYVVTFYFVYLSFFFLLI